MNSSRLPTPPPNTVHAPYIPPPAPSLAGGEGSPYSTVRRLLLPARTRKALNRRAGRRGQLTSPSNQTWSSSNRAPGPLHRRRTPALGRLELARAWISPASVTARGRAAHGPATAPWAPPLRPPGDLPPMAHSLLLVRWPPAIALRAWPHERLAGRRIAQRIAAARTPPSRVSLAVCPVGSGTSGIRGGRPPSGKHRARRGKAKVVAAAGGGRAGRSRRMELGGREVEEMLLSLSFRQHGRGQREDGGNGGRDRHVGPKCHFNSRGVE
jgi:hypothetical protein